MKIQRVWAVYYSATGCTAQAVETLAKALADTLRVPWQKDEFTTPDQRNTVRYFAPEEIVVFGMPVYAGRLPNKLLDVYKRQCQIIARCSGLPSLSTQRQLG